MGDLSPHFSSSEFACPHCQHCSVSGKLILALEEVRNIAGVPSIIHDGYRCPEHNAAVGGVLHSEHVLGLAADFHLVGKNLQEMYDITKQVPEFRDGGIGVYDGNFIHADVRSNGKARWARKNGVYLALDTLVIP